MSTAKMDVKISVDTSAVEEPLFEAALKAEKMLARLEGRETVTVRRWTQEKGWQEWEEPVD